MIDVNIDEKEVDMYH